VVEALYCGCVPILPRRLSYPELLPSEHHATCLYDDQDELVEKLRAAFRDLLALKARDFVEAARTIGATRTRIVLRHIVPNLLSTLIVQVSLALSWAVLTEGALSFLGLSAQPPAPSWGVMLSEGRQYLEFATHLAIFPGLAIMIAVLGFNLLGDGLRDALDPQRR